MHRFTHSHLTIPIYKQAGSFGIAALPDAQRNLYVNFERIPLQPEQQGRYVISHSSYGDQVPPG